MLTPDEIRSLVPWLIGLPIVAALLLKFLGSAFVLARRTALVCALAHLLLTGMIVATAWPKLAHRQAENSRASLSARAQVFLPEYVPGDPGVEAKNAQGEIILVPSHTTRWTLFSFSSTGEPHQSGVQFFIGIDGLNLWLIALTSLMMVPIILISWESTTIAPGAFYSWLFLLQACVLGVFLSFDLLLFYICFELTLVPLYFLISYWGTGASRRDAARKLFLFTLAGGLITLLGISGTIAAVYQRTHELTFSIPRLAELLQLDLHTNRESALEFWKHKEYYLFIAIAVGFMVKIPLIPVHSWLPAAYSEAPIGVTVMLSALLAKMGTFGLLRICLPLAPDGAFTAGLPILGTLGALGILYAALCAYTQGDMKRLIAYSSISHLGFCVIALVAFTAQSMAGGLLHMVNHGLSTGALFLMVGLIIDRYSTSQIADYSGLWHKLPRLTFFMMVFCLTSIGLPGLCNFISEMLMLSGLFEAQSNQVSIYFLAGSATVGIFLGAWYTLTFVQRVFFKDLKEPIAPGQKNVNDLNIREFAIVAPLAALCLLIGFFPQYLIAPMQRDVATLARIADDSKHDYVPVPVVDIRPESQIFKDRPPKKMGKKKNPGPKNNGTMEINPPPAPK